MGLSVGLCLTERYRDQLDVTIMADRFSPHTTSDRAGGWITPYFVGSARSGDQVKLWTEITFDYLKGLHTSSLHEAGVNVVDCYTACRKAGQRVPSYYRELMLEFKVLSQQEAASLKLPISNFKEFWSYKTFVVEGRKYLPWLAKGFQRNGGLVERRKVTNFNELSAYDVVIKCTGLGARDLVQDTTVYPVRGQIVTVEMEGVRGCYEILEDPCIKVVPHSDWVLLGGSDESDNWSTTPDPTVASSIFEKCLELVPALKGATVTGGGLA